MGRNPYIFDELTAAHCTNLQRPIARRLALPSTTYYYYYCRVSALLTHPLRRTLPASSRASLACLTLALCAVCVLPTYNMRTCSPRPSAGSGSNFRNRGY
jgi:hypothetical protein